LLRFVVAHFVASCGLRSVYPYVVRSLFTLFTLRFTFICLAWHLVFVVHSVVFFGLRCGFPLVDLVFGLLFRSIVLRVWLLRLLRSDVRSVPVPVCSFHRCSSRWLFVLRVWLRLVVDRLLVWVYVLRSRFVRLRCCYILLFGLRLLRCWLFSFVSLPLRCSFVCYVCVCVVIPRSTDPFVYSYCLFPVVPVTLLLPGCFRFAFVVASLRSVCVVMRWFRLITAFVVVRLVWLIAVDFVALLRFGAYCTARSPYGTLRLLAFAFSFCVWLFIVLVQFRSFLVSVPVCPCVVVVVDSRLF
jgi:hypothetical protein